VIAFAGLAFFIGSWLRRPATGRVTRTLFPVQVTASSPWTALTGAGGGGANYSAITEAPGAAGDAYRALSPDEGGGGVRDWGANGGAGGLGGGIAGGGAADAGGRRHGVIALL
jgi:hypothetical protein